MQTADIIAERLGLGASSIQPEQGLCEQVISMRAPSAPIFLSPLELSGLLPGARVDASRASLRPVVHAQTDGLAMRDLDRMGKEKINGGDPEIHHWCELHPEHDVRLEADKVDEIAGRITSDRCAVTVDRILHDPQCNKQGILLMCHGASARYIMRHLTKDDTVNSGTVASIAVLTETDSVDVWTATPMSNKHLETPPPAACAEVTDVDNT